MHYRNETGIHRYLHIREHLPAFYAGGIWHYEEINNGKYYYREQEWMTNIPLYNIDRIREYLEQ